MTRVSGDRPDELLPSFDLVRSELDIQQADVARRASSIDSKAGIILGAAGVVVALKPYSPSVLNVAGTVAAAASAALAVWSFAPRPTGAILPINVRNRYIHRPVAETRLVLLDSRLSIYEEQERLLRTKWSRLRFAMLGLALSAVLTTVGSITFLARGNQVPSCSVTYNFNVTIASSGHPYQGAIDGTGQSKMVQHC